MLKNFFVVAYLKLTDKFVTRTTTSFFEYKISHQKFTLILYGINTTRAKEFYSLCPTR